MGLFRKKQTTDAAPLPQQREDMGYMDVPLLALTLLLVAIGLVMMFSASYARAYNDTGNSAHYFVRQTIYAGVGLVFMLLAARLNYFVWYRLSLLIMAGAVFLLLLVPIIGVEHNGAKRWLNLGIEFQPSEVAKIAMIIFFASMMAAWQDKMDTFRYGVLPYAAVIVLIAGLLAIEKHLSATVIFLAVAAIMMFMGGTKLRWLALGAVLALVFLFVYIRLRGYAGGRVDSWLDPFSDPLEGGYQGLQSRYAIGSGGFLGLGFGRSRQKYLYLPEEHNDYIFAIICEELGFVGAISVLLLFVLLILRGFWIALHARDRFSALLAAGIIAKLAVQVFLNVGVVTGLLPATGISLPLFSYGGTALTLQMVELGIVLGVSRWCVNKEVWGKKKA